MTRAVLDTNVFVSAFLILGRLNRMAGLVEKGAFLWLISQEILEEYATVALRPLFKLSTEEAESLLYQIKERATWVDVQSHFTVITADPSDNKFLACAVDGHADWIVTGDRHLLALKKFRAIRIGKPAQFLQELRGRGSK